MITEQDIYNQLTAGVERSLVLNGYRPSDFFIEYHPEINVMLVRQISGGTATKLFHYSGSIH